MTRILLIFFASTLTTSCDRIGSTRSSSFYKAHDARAYFDSLTRASGYERGAGGSRESINAIGVEKEFEILIKGDEKLRNRLMRDYKDEVEKQLNSLGAKFSGGVAGQVADFDIYYSVDGFRGIFRMNTVVDKQDYINILIYIIEPR